MKNKVNIANLSWHPKVKELLENQNYQALINFYAQLIEENTEEFNNYYYLGLAYLL